MASRPHDADRRPWSVSLRTRQSPDGLDRGASQRRYIATESTLFDPG